MKGSPLVSVLMPVFNAEQYLSQSIESILNQTYIDFNFYIVNDGSTDASEKIILSYKDERIIYVKNEINKGLIYSLNKGFEIIQSKYLVRMDADDISLPERIEEQFKFMEKHSDVCLCASQVEYFGQVQKTSKFPTTHEAISASLLFGNCIAHSSVIMRMEKIRKNRLNFNSNFIHIEDYELWIRLAKVSKIALIDKVLLRYRMEGQNITINNWQTRKVRLFLVYKQLLIDLGIPLTEERLNMHIELSGNTETIGGIDGLINYTNEIRRQNELKKSYAVSELNDVLNLNWQQLFFKVVKNGWKEVVKYWWFTKNISKLQIRYIIGHYKSTWLN